jgi:hypothetical protein
VFHLYWLSALPSYEEELRGSNSCSNVSPPQYKWRRCRQYMTLQVEARRYLWYQQNHVFSIDEGKMETPASIGSATWNTTHVCSTVSTTVVSDPLLL